jgi:hypothetical protein
MFDLRKRGVYRRPEVDGERRTTSLSAVKPRSSCNHQIAGL